MRHYGPGRSRPSWMIIFVVLLAVLSACGGGQNASGGSTGKPEQSRITVGTLPIVDSAALYIAMKKGYFAAEGLQVDLRTLNSGAAAVPALANNELQFSFGNYVSFFAAKASGALDAKLVADGYQARPGMFLIMVNGNSPIKQATDLAGKKIAVNARANVAELTVSSALQTAGVDPKSVAFTPLAFGDMASALARKTVDAALLVEPYITQAEKDFGDVPLVDAASGPTADLPIAGWVTSAKFAADKPNTVRAFQRAILKGQADAADRVEVEQALTEFVKVDSVTASLMHLGAWPTTLEPTRIQRVVDLMTGAGQLSAPIDPRSMIISPPAAG
jgi:NitT/TauT family transport system substrate-binding protein